MERGTLDRLKDKSIEEIRKLLWIFAYLWVLLGLFSLHKAIILQDANPFYHQGFAVINALVMAKIVYVAEAFHVADNLKSRPLIYPIVYRSAMFALILILFHIMEEALRAKWHGKPWSEVLAASGAGSLLELLVLGLIIFLSMMPFFALREVGRDIGEDKMFEQFFLRRTTHAPVQSQ